MMGYQILPDLSAEDYAALKADIAARGVMVAVEYDEAGNVIDGHHRLRICKELGLSEWPKSIRAYADEAAKRTQARKLNIARRHLDRETRRLLIAEELKENPVKPNKQISDELGVSDMTVKSVRNDLEATSQIGTLDHVRRRDGAMTPLRKRRNAGVEPEPESKPRSNGHAKIKAAKNETVETIVRRGMVLEAEGLSPDKIAKSIGIAEITFRHARDIVALSERGNLRAADRKLANEALVEMNATRQIIGAYERILPLVRKMWGDGKGGGRATIEAYRLECFDRAFSALLQTCSTANEIEIPYLSRERAAEALEELTAAQKPIRELILKLKEACRE